MPRVRYPVTDFSRGELSDTMAGRVDLEQYRRGARRMLNATILEEGGATRRPGTRYIADAKFHTAPIMLVDFESSSGQPYVLEFGEGYIRFFKDDQPIEIAMIPVEVASPYLAVDLGLLRFVPIADVLFIFAQFYAPRRLEHYSDTVWKLKTHPPTNTGRIAVPPSFEYGERPFTTLTAGATSGTGVTFTASGNQFLASDVDRELLVFAGANIGARALVRTVVGPTQVTADITENWANTSATAASDWKITGSPQTTCTPSAEGPFNATITLTLGVAGWRSTDLGKRVVINGGVCLITQVTSTTVVNAGVLSLLASTTAAQGDAWSLEEDAWSSFNGYPAAGALFQDRLWAGGTLAQPQTLWGSVTGDYNTFQVGTDADDGLAFGLTTTAIRWLLPSRALRVGAIEEESVVDGGGTGGDSVITPTTVRERPQTSYGSPDDIAPLRVGAVSLFTSRSRRRLRELVYNYETDTDVAPDLLLLSRHLTRAAGIRQIAYQREPISTIWLPRDDGVLLGCTYLRDQNVVGWHRHVTDGQVETVAVVPTPDRTKHRVWLGVMRTINGATKRYIEILDDDGWYFSQLHVDSAAVFDNTVTGATLTPGATSGVDVTFTAGAAVFAGTAADVGKEVRRVTLPGRGIITAPISTTQATVEIISDFPDTNPIPAGAWALCPFTYTLAHLAGKTIRGTADGAVLPDAVANGAGSVTFQSTGVLMEMGLGYDTEIEPMPADLPQLGTVRGLPKRLFEFTVYFHETIGAEIRGDQIPFRTTGDPLGVQIPPFTGLKTYPTRGWDKDATAVIAQRQPLPFRVLFVSFGIDVGA